MKLKLYSIPLLFALILTNTSCSKSDDSNDSVEKCATISNFTISQNVDVLNYKIQSSGDIQAYQISLELATIISSPGDNSLIIDVDENVGAIDIPYHLEFDKTYKIHVRAICNNGSISNWFTTKTLFIKSFCGKPTDVNFGFNYMSWSNPNDDNSTQYQVQYSLKGFSLGNGTTVNISSGNNSLNFSQINLQTNRTYDFYVRSNCSQGKGWSSWSGPYSFYYE